MKASHHIVSLSLGTVAEPSGLVVVKPWSALCPPDGREPNPAVGNQFDVKLIDRFPVG